LREARILVFPGTLFGDAQGRHIRISLLQPVARIQEAFERIAAVRDCLFQTAEA